MYLGYCKHYINTGVAILIIDRNFFPLVDERQTVGHLAINILLFSYIDWADKAGQNL